MSYSETNEDSQSTDHYGTSNVDCVEVLKVKKGVAGGQVKKTPVWQERY